MIIRGKQQDKSDGATEMQSDRIDQGLITTSLVAGTEISGYALEGIAVDGTPGDDTLFGTEGDDTIHGLDGNDQIYGLVGNDSLFGDAGDDVLWGDAGNDYLDGGTGNDTMFGGAGDDTYILDSEGDWVNEYANEGNDTILSSATVMARYSSIETIMLTGDAAIGAFADDTDNTITGNDAANGLQGNGGNDTIFGDGGDDYINGDDGNDSLNGGSGNDIVFGGAGNDGMLGGTGDDIYILDSDGDWVDEYANEGNDTILSSATVLAQYSSIETITLTGNAAVGVAADDSDNTITGNDAANGLEGNGGNDTIFGNGGDDFIHGGYGNDSLYGGAGSDQLSGGAGNDRLDGGTGNDTMFGGAGDDIYILDSDGDWVDEYANEGNDTILSSATVMARYISIENITLTGDGAIDATADDFDNTITGNDAANGLEGNGGNDTIFGNGGDDIISGGDGNDSLYGGSGNDILVGVAGNDYLDGGSGNDTMFGGTGDDTYILDSEGDWVNEYANEGNDTVLSSATVMARYSSIETITLTGDAAINAVADDSDNTITGNEAANGLQGYGGNDTISGNGGDDFIHGGYGNDSLYGGSGNDNLFGDAGNDYLDGGTGNDTMFGGTGDDTYILDSEGDWVNEYANEGNDTVLSSATVMARYSSIETITLTGDAAINAVADDSDNTITGNEAANGLQGYGGNDTISGNGGDDHIEGNDGNDSLYGGAGSDQLFGAAGNDLLDGGSGNDTMFGGTGDDVYVWSRGSGNDFISESGGGTSVDSINFGTLNIADVNIAIPYLADDDSISVTIKDTGEVLRIGNWFSDLQYRIESFQFNDGTLSDADVQALVTANPIMGTEGNDLIRTPRSLSTTVYGLGGNDTIQGSTASQTIFGGDGRDSISASGSLYGEAGNDTVFGGAGNDFVSGGSGNDYIVGWDGNDTLDGGTGDDNIQGLVGDDTYLWDIGMGNDQVTDTSGIDTINFGTLRSDDVEYYISPNLLDTIFMKVKSTGETLQLVLWLADDQHKIENLQFSDRILTAAEAQALAAQNGAFGTEGNDMIWTPRYFSATIHAGGGNDTVTGGGGGTAVAGHTIYAGAGNDWVFGGQGNNIIYGESGDDRIYAYDGNDLIDGGIGNDTMHGGAGDDTYVVDGAADFVGESVDEGTDTIMSSISLSLVDNVENLALTGSAAIDGTGNTLNNAITGNTGNNILTGGLGNDSLYGAAGADTLYGNEDNDLLDGGLGNDTMYGGAGNDTYVIDASGDQAIENAGEGIDSVISSRTYTLTSNVENLTLTGSSAINGTGNSLDNILVGSDGNNRLTGNAGNDYLDGGLGNDTMYGGTGDDTYVVQASGDYVVEYSGQGTDTVLSSRTYTLSSNVENLTLTGSLAINGSGNSLNNVLTGNSAANTLSGGSGADTLTGAAGNDSLNGGSGNDTYIFALNDGIDTITDSGTDASTQDRVLFGSDVLQNTVALFQSGQNLVIGYGTNDVVTVSNQMSASYGVEKLELNSGLFLNNADINTVIQQITAFASANGISLTSINDVRNNQELMTIISNSWHG